MSEIVGIICPLVDSPPNKKRAYGNWKNSPWALAMTAPVEEMDAILAAFSGRVSRDD